MKMKWAVLGSIAALLALLAVQDVRDVVAQLPNTLNISSAASGSAPAVRANGLDANININLVPKGSGVVQVNGTPIAVGGGTVTSLSINPGPLNVTGSLFITPGTSGVLKRVGARVFNNATDAPTTGTAIETLYTYNMPANTLAVDGESLRFTVQATTAANGNNKTLIITFGATTIATSTAAGFNNNTLVAQCDLFRTGAATQKALCNVDQTLVTLGARASISTVTTPAETLSGAVAILVRGTTPTAAADLTARYATIDWYPVGQ